MIKYFKWIAGGLALGATMLMFNKTIAAQSPWPWILWFVSNVIYLYDRETNKDLAWSVTLLIFIILDILLIGSRMFI